MTLPFDPADWASYLPCNENYEVPLLCRPNFKDFVYTSGGIRLLNSASDPTGYKAVAGSIYYNSADQTIKYRTNSSFVELAASGAPAPAEFPLEAVSATDATQILTSTVLPDSQPTFDILADGTYRMFNGSGTLLQQFRYDAIDSEWVFEFTNGSQDGRLKLSQLRAENMTSSGNLTFVGATSLQLSTLANSIVIRAANQNIDASTETLALNILNAATSNVTNLIASGSVSTPSITAVGASIAFNSKNLTGVGTIGCTTLTASTSVSTPSITTSGSSITFNSKDITNVGTLSATNVNAVSGSLNINSSGGNIVLTPATTGSIIGNNLRGTIGNATVGLCPVYVIDTVVATGISGTGTISVASYIIPGGLLTSNGDLLRIRIYGAVTGGTGNSVGLRMNALSPITASLIDGATGSFVLDFMIKFITNSSYRQLQNGIHGTAAINGTVSTVSSGIDFSVDNTLELRVAQGTSLSVVFSGGTIELIKPSVL